jgi:hypothetical protein
MCICRWDLVCGSIVHCSDGEITKRACRAASVGAFFVSPPAVVSGS